MKLNIYEKKQIVKTYEARTYDLMFGTLEDVAGLLKIDELKSLDDVEIVKFVTNFVINAMDTTKELMLDIFEDLTEEELRKAKVNEMVDVIVEVIIFTFSRINKLPRKN